MYTRDFAFKSFSGTLTSPLPVMRWNYPATPTAAITDLLHSGFLAGYADDSAIDVTFFLNIVTYEGEVLFNDLRYPMTGDDLLELQVACALASPNSTIVYH